MKTPDEIKKGLDVCAGLDGDCEACPYDDRTIFCADKMRKDALAYIQQLESQLAKTQREKDAAVRDIHYVLHTKGTIDAECLICNMEKPDCKWECEKAKWRGVCAENTKEE